MLVSLDDASNWLLWFLQLSGWPVFLLVVGAAMSFALVATVVLTWASSRSVAVNAVLAFLTLGLTVFLLLALLTLFSRALFGPAS